MNADIQQIIITVNQAYGLLFFAICLNLFKPGKPSHTIIYVHHIITGRQGPQLSERDGFGLGIFCFGFYTGENGQTTDGRYNRQY